MKQSNQTPERQLILLLLVLSIAAIGATAVEGLAQISLGQSLYAVRCRSCHEQTAKAATGNKTPTHEELRRLPTAEVFFALTNGSMKAQAQGLSLREIVALVDYSSAGSETDYQTGANSP